MKTNVRISRNSPAEFTLHKAIIAILLAAIWLAVVGTARAENRYWINPGGGSWSDTNNWSPLRISPPTTGDNVFITAAGTYTVNCGGTVDSLTLGDGVSSFPTLLLNSAGITVWGGAYAAPGSQIILTGGDPCCLFSGGSFEADGGLTLEGEMDWQSGCLYGIVTVTTNGLISSSSSLNHFTTAKIYNHGQILWGADNLIFGSGAEIQNLSDGLLDWQNDTTVNSWPGGLVCPVINSSTMLKSAGTGALNFNNATFSNSGTVQVESGTLNLCQGLTDSGTFVVSDGCALWLLGGTCYFNPGHAFIGAGSNGVPSGGQITLYGTINDTNFLMNGQLYGTNILTGTMNAYDGYFVGATTIATNGVLNASGCSSCGAVWYSTQVGGVLTNAGTLNWLSGDWTSEGGGVVNLPDGLITIQCDNYYGSWAGLDNWNNQGVIRKSAGAGTNGLAGVALNNSGLVDVQSGGLAFPSGFTSSGTFNVADGAGLPLSGGTCFLNPGNAFTGAGFYGVADANVTIFGEIVATNFQMNGGLYGTNTLAGTMTCYDGYFGGTTTVASNAVLNLNGCSSCGAVWYSTRIGGVLTNAGTVNWLSGDWVSEGGNVVNLPDGLITIQCDNYYGSWAGLDNWNNQGVIRKSAGAGTNGLAGLALNNSGLVDVQSGGLAFPSGFTSSGTFNVADGAGLPLSAGIYYFNPGHAFTGAGFYGVPAGGNVTINGTITDTNFQMNGTLSGANILTGTMNVYGGYFDGATTIASNGVLNLSGCTGCGLYYSTRIAGVLTNAGTLNWLSGDWFSYSGTVVNLADALITIQCDNGYGSWGGNDTWLNAGTIRKFASASTNIISAVVLNNTGLVDVQSGGLSLLSLNNSGTFNVASGTSALLQGGTMSGTFNVASGASVLLQSGTFDLNPGNAFTGAGFYGVPAVGNVTINGTITDTNFQMNGTLYGANILAGTMNAYGGFFCGATTIASNGVLNLSGCTGCGLYYSTRIAGVLTNAGTLNWLSGDWFSYSGTVVNLAGALITIQCDNSYWSWGGNDNWLNAGTIRKFASAGTNVISAVVLDNTGLVDVQSGGLSLLPLNNSGTFNVASGAAVLLQGGTMSGTFNVASGASVLMQSGTYNLNPGNAITGEGFYGVPYGGNVTLYGTITDTNFQMNGTLSGANILTGTMNAYGGYFDGTTTIASNGVLNLSGCTSCGLFYSTRITGVLTNAGTVNWLSGDWFSYSGTVVNLADALITIQCDNGYWSWGGNDNWLNAGTIRKFASAGTNVISAVVLDNTGLVDVQSGGLSLLSLNNSGTFNVASGAAVLLQGGTMSGTFNVASGASVLLQSGTFNLNPGHAFTGAGFYGVPVGGNMTINGTIADANFQMNGTLYGENILTGTMNAYDGFFGGVTTIASNGVLNLSGCTGCGLYYSTRIAGVLTNAGTLNWLSGDWFSYSGTVVNLAGALITIQCDNGYGNWGGNDSWFNAGTIRKFASAGTNIISAVVLDNTGLVDVQSGALQLQNTYSQTGGELCFGLASPDQYGHIILAGNAPLTGTLSANLLGGYHPAFGDTFNILTYASFSGSFTNLNLPALTGLKQWSLTNSDTVTTLSIVKARPALAIAIAASDGNFSINWSSDADAGAMLQSATNLAPPVVWQNVTNDVQVIGDQNTVTVPLTDGSVFFRLQE